MTGLGFDQVVPSLKFGQDLHQSGARAGGSIVKAANGRDIPINVAQLVGWAEKASHHHLTFRKLLLQSTIDFVDKGYFSNLLLRHNDLIGLVAPSRGRRITFKASSGPRQRPQSGVVRITTPLRIQRKRTKGWRLPPNTVCITRPSPYSNPFIPGQEIPFLPGRLVQDKRHAARLFAGHAPQNERLVAAARAELAGKNLACFCHLCDLHADGKPFDEDCPFCDPCHADMVGKIANATEASAA